MRWIPCQVLSQSPTGIPVVNTDLEVFNRTQYCKWPCKCPKVAPVCPLGVSLLTDGCDCCKACAKQLGETCNERDTCDYHKGLYCDYSSDKPRYEKGVCALGPEKHDTTRILYKDVIFSIQYLIPDLIHFYSHIVMLSKSLLLFVDYCVLDLVGTGCEYNGVIYRNGQTFQPSCKYRCLCVNGAIGCVPLCTDSLPPWGWCRLPKLVKIPGRCCEQWICNEPRKTRRTTPRHAVEVSLSTNEIWHNNCITQTTPWSPCSKTCDRGVSMRLSNDNAQCMMENESRLCNLRPCDVDITKHFRPGKQCLNIYREPEFQNFTISGCVSKKPYWPKYCGVCSDERCCIPYKSKTIEVEFECPNGAVFTWKYMWINACFCNLSCRNPNDIFADLQPYYEHNEIMN
ncbi:cellular communication network factor 4b isoform 2-T2 [Clarias gariepinus]|uniref:cellular communication network factor 4b isoform X2 n=1 Tax=Clarias gariepinus TaxID=13013 RepID=UPI00234CBFBA|nr:cellular communication network factor 4b isoform X2 [Clarias gariepinus]